ncbi:hypothetical protein GCM10011348_35230 [Marinobacterium nitratireducens]|uniref:DUF2750 domain-containing protein n=1 Tax=Marinobacterium nitratireducens TaxID=518897 RepID=A0A917ZNC5_9GAMM|nr:DUF2750 domain-containing protein [Marinobacterium nitratireducens]GGO85813.1 hypothetical protein GCM10011348_35230 [Marinobacterium nitratireducens]
MTYKLTEQQRTRVQERDAQERFDHFLEKTADWEEIWSLADANGCVMLTTDDGESCLPVWPHPDYALDWATEGWEDCEPLKIDLESWFERWTPGLEEDEILVAVFPRLDDEGVLVSSRELSAAIEALFGAGGD